ncbi:Potassium voltage-gated channel protein Shaw [Lamellibrachia satsuma]|nr:Potassium voltage-gated channel protein Shaw [Lamellibrachia satsuma]
MDTLAKRRNTRLSALNKDSRNYRTNCNEYFFDRDPIIFRSVIDFYRTGTLHLPSDICSTIIRRELEYWNIHEEHVAPCCWGFFRAHKDQETTVKLFSKAMGRDVDQHQRKRSQWKLALWTFLEDPSSSRNALFYSYWIGFAILMSLMSIIWGNTDLLRVPAKVLRLHFNQTDNKKLMRFETTDPHPTLVIVDTVLVTFFMVEFSIRAIVCPNKWTFFTNSINVIEILAVYPKAVVMTLRYAVTDLSNRPKLYMTYWFLNMFDIFRVLRALKFNQYFIGLRVLVVTLRASAIEMSFLMVLMAIGAIAFGIGIYYCEFWTTHTILDMPTGTYWALITMTTVGYGDEVPVTALGRITAVLCSFAGCLFTGLAVPIIAESFNRYYLWARLILMRHRLGYMT